MCTASLIMVSEFCCLRVAEHPKSVAFLPQKAVELVPWSRRESLDQVRAYWKARYGRDGSHEKTSDDGCGAGIRSVVAAARRSWGCSLRRSASCRCAGQTSPADTVPRARRTQRPRPARLSRLARRTRLARSSGLAWTAGVERPTLLVWPPLGAATLLRHDHSRRCARHADHRRRGWIRSAATGSQPVLVLGRSLRKPRILGLLLRIHAKANRSSTDVSPTSPAKGGVLFIR
jgi:hypothetical protein